MILRAPMEFQQLPLRCLIVDIDNSFLKVYALSYNEALLWDTSSVPFPHTQRVLTAAPGPSSPTEARRLWVIIVSRRYSRKWYIYTYRFWWFIEFNTLSRLSGGTFVTDCMQDAVCTWWFFLHSWKDMDSGRDLPECHKVVFQRGKVT